MHTSAWEKKDKLYDKVEGGLNTSVLMTPCWDHLFPDKRAQGWEKKEYKTARRCGKGGAEWELGMKCVFVCIHMCTWTDECVLSVCVLVYVDHYSCFATLCIRHKRQKASYLCLHVKDYLFY